MDRDPLLKESITPQEDTIAERFRPVPGSEDAIEETEALKRSPAPQEIFHPREPGPHPRP